METKVTNKGRPAVLVDWKTFQDKSSMRHRLGSYKNHAAIVLLVSDPENDDYDYEYPELFDIVVRNHGMTTNMAFKVQALCAIQDTSLLLPVVAIDENDDICEMFFEGGVLTTYYG